MKSKSACIFQTSAIHRSFCLAVALIGFVGSAFAGEDFNWPDRRPIAAIFLANSAQNWPKNPRGYFNDPNMDVNTDAGRAQLRERMMKLADNTIARVREVGAQGIIIWDIEGDEMPHAVTYLGDPRILPKVAPEMDAIADDFFKKFQDAGIRTGICIRPSSIVFKDPSDPAKYPWIKGRYGHTDGPEPVKNLADKISYAKKRWGCTIYYMDTNFTPKMVNGEMVRKAKGIPDFRMLSSTEMAELHKLHPDTLIWPEFQEPDYYASCSGYGEYRQVGDFSAVERQKYPKAFRVWMPRLLPDDIYAKWDDFVKKGVMAGEVFLFECSPMMSPMGTVLKNAQSDAALRSNPGGFKAAGDGPGLVGQLKSETDWAKKRCVIDAMAGHPDQKVTTALVEVMESSSNGLEYFAARSLGKQGTPDSITALAGMMKGKERIKKLAIVGLGASGKVQAVEALTPLLKEQGPPEVRWAVLDALAELGSNQAVPALLENLNSLYGSTATLSKDKTIRALGSIGDPRAVGPLTAALASQDFSQQRPLIKRALVAIATAQTGGTVDKK